MRVGEMMGWLNDRQPNHKFDFNLTVSGALSNDLYELNYDS
jgi:hypothetical protein